MGGCWNDRMERETTVGMDGWNERTGVSISSEQSQAQPEGRIG